MSWVGNVAVKPSRLKSVTSDLLRGERSRYNSMTDYESRRQGYRRESSRAVCVLLIINFLPDASLSRMRARARLKLARTLNRKMQNCRACASVPRLPLPPPSRGKSLAIAVHPSFFRLLSFYLIVARCATPTETCDSFTRANLQIRAKPHRMQMNLIPRTLSSLRHLWNNQRKSATNDLELIIPGLARSIVVEFIRLTFLIVHEQLWPAVTRFLSEM